MCFVLPRKTTTQVFYQRFFMRFWGHITAKPTFVLANSPGIVALDHGPLKRKQLESDIQTTDKYEAADGKCRFKGNQNLKGTQFLT